MLTVVLPDSLEIAVTAAAHRTGLSIDDYLAAVCADALSLKIDRARVDSFLACTPAISHDRARSWLADLAKGNRTECQR